MKRYIWSLFFLALMNANASQFKSFEEIKQEFQVSGDLQRASYLFYRCAALWTVHSALALRGGDQSTGQKFQNAAAEYMVMADAIEQKIDANRKLGQSSQDRKKNQNITFFQTMVEEYQKKMIKNYALTGHYIIDDPELRREVDHCKNANALFEWLTSVK